VVSHCALILVLRGSAVVVNLTDFKEDLVTLKMPWAHAIKDICLEQVAAYSSRRSEMPQLANKPKRIQEGAYYYCSSKAKASIAY
jgi:hypothetical protein